MEDFNSNIDSYINKLTNANPTQLLFMDAAPWEKNAKGLTNNELKKKKEKQFAINYIIDKYSSDKIYLNDLFR